MMDSYPSTPLYGPPPVPSFQGPTTQITSEANTPREGTFIEQNAAVEYEYDYPLEQPYEDRHVDEDPIIPNSILFQMARNQYRSLSRKFDAPNGKRHSTISLLEVSEQLYEAATNSLASQEYQKTASCYIKGYMNFKFAEKMNKEPSIADLINSLRNIYSSELFAKLKDIVDDVFIEERDKRYSTSSETETFQNDRLLPLGDSDPAKLNTRAQYHEQAQQHTYYQPAFSSSSSTKGPMTRSLDPYIGQAPINHSSHYGSRSRTSDPPPIPAPVPPVSIHQRPRLETPKSQQYDQHLMEHHQRVPHTHYNVPPQSTPPPTPPLSICGLQNFGNTCYLNSLIQCLYNIKAFSHFFKSNMYVEYAHPVEGKSRDICLSYGLGSLFRVMEKNSGSIVAPTRFFNYLLAVSDFKKYEQQDAEEALLFIFNRLHEELSNNDLAVQNFPRAFSRYSTDKEYNKWFDSKIEKEKLSPINGYFEGQQVSSLRCQACGFSSNTYSCFNSLSLNLPPIAAKGSGSISLEDLIGFYTATEELHGTDSWKCPECDKNRKAQVRAVKDQISQKHEEEWRNLVEKNSSTEFIESQESLKENNKSRFFFRKKKLKNHVSDATTKAVAQLEESQENDINDFNMRLYNDQVSASSTRTTLFLSLPSFLIVHIQRSVKGARLATNIKYPLILEIDNAMGNRVRYKLQSTINHTGTSPYSGHYTALCNKSDHLSKPRWCQFNDDHFILDMSHGDITRGIKRLSSHDVYLLFYERIDR